MSKNWQKLRTSCINYSRKQYMVKWVPKIDRWASKGQKMATKQQKRSLGGHNQKISYISAKMQFWGLKIGKC